MADAGYIFQGRLLLAVFGEETGGFALEIEHDEVSRFHRRPAGPEDLPQVVVAVDANALAGGR